jgi:hypothetical protein
LLVASGFKSNVLSYLVAVLRGDSKITGTVTFEQATENAPTTISWNITGHDPNAERGFHVHQFGDNTNGCTSAGPHCASSFPLPWVNDARTQVPHAWDIFFSIETLIKLLMFLWYFQSTPLARAMVPLPMRTAMSVT